MSQIDERILIVDDNPGLVFGLRIFLKQAGYARVDAASNAEDALAAAARGPLALAVLDYNLAEGCAVELIPRLRASRVLVMSGDTDVREEVLAAGADAFLAKPFQPAELLDQVQALLPVKGSR